MLLDFWDKSNLVVGFMDLYGVSGRQMCEILERIQYNSEDDFVKVFCEETDIKLDEVDVSHDVELLGKIVSTTIDDFSYIKKHGLLHLDELLENDTPISRHLKKYGISINPELHKISIGEKTFFIPTVNHVSKRPFARRFRATVTEK
ncbi:MAG: hypothetical protein K6F88_07890 [Ruminococcus sp.]|nr:hypothetical protein [Ruminococcus sp.]